MCCVGKINSISWTTWNTTVHTEPSDGQYSAACRYFYKGIVTGSVVNDSLIKYPDCGLFRDCHREKRYLCAKCVTIYAIFMEYFLDVVPGKRRQSAIKWMDLVSLNLQLTSNEIDSDWLLYIHLILIIKLCSYSHWIVDSCWFAIDKYLLFIVTEHILSFWQYIVHHKSLGISALPALLIEHMRFILFLNIFSELHKMYPSGFSL